jgi:predicted DNA-binding protein
MTEDKKVYRVSGALPHELGERLKQYQEKTGCPIIEQLRRAVESWLTSQGA